MSAPDATEPVGRGTVLSDRYRLVRLVAQGGMASVWEGHDNVLARAVAVKMLHPHLAQDRLFLERFRREAISAARLAHPNIVATFDAGITKEGTAFIVMELIRGRTLSAFAADHRPLPLFVIVEVAMQIADALAHAHAAGLVHRDIKPANVLVCDKFDGGVPLVKVTDFGIAKATEGLGLELTRTGMILGTPKYLSPEQIEGREPDARADLYALGVVLFELVTGSPPFQGPSEMAMAVQHLNDRPPPLGKMRSGVPASLEGLVTALLAKRPADRPSSAAALRQALATIDLHDLPSGATGPNSSPATGARPSTTPTSAPQSPGGGGGGPTGPPPGPSAPPRTEVTSTRVSSRPAGRGGGGKEVPATTVGGVSPRTPAPGRTGPSSPGPPMHPTGPARGGAPSRPPAPGTPRRPNWAGRLVAALVVLAVIVVVAVSQSRSGPSASSAPGLAIHIQAVSVFHLERDADGAASVGNAIDGNPATAWTTDHYFGSNFAGLRRGLGLAMVLDTRQTLHTLSVLSPTSGWRAEIYVADRVPDPPALAPWGPPVAAKQGGAGTTTFDLRGRRGAAILFWLTDLGPGNQAAIDELSVR